MRMIHIVPYFMLLVLSKTVLTEYKDTTSTIFGQNTRITPAAFGDFNSDEVTDLFAITEDNHAIEVYIADLQDTTYYKTQSFLTCTLDAKYTITNVVPGDFDGDSWMDALVSARTKDNPSISYLFVHRGVINQLNGSSLECATEFSGRTYDEPLVINYRANMVADIFAQDGQDGRNSDRTKNIYHYNNITKKFVVASKLDGRNSTLKFPHSHAFVDMNGDNYADLFLTTTEGFEVWCSNISSNTQFEYCDHIPLPDNPSKKIVSQSLLVDLETTGRLNPIVARCDKNGQASAIYAYLYEKKNTTKGRWKNLVVDFSDQANEKWGFVGESANERYLDTITLRAGDYNNDGYVDLIVTLKRVEDVVATSRVFILENIPTDSSKELSERKFTILWDALPNSKNTQVMGAFFDYLQNGFLDIMMVQHHDNGYSVVAMKNENDFDANFIKVTVIGEITNAAQNGIQQKSSLMSFGEKRFYGTNLAGPRVTYLTTTSSGNGRTGCAVQLPQSAHFSLHLPYIVFGLDRTSNFVEDIKVQMFNQTKTLSPLIPNSQLVVIIPDNAVNNPDKWRAQIFVQPSKIIGQTGLALLGTCAVICIIIGILDWKERREDKLERLQESHRFHFDAM